jgi:hypothetical protein
MKKIILFTIVFFITNGVIAQQRIRFAPKNEIITDTSLKKFIDILKATVRKKDFKKLYFLLDNNIINGFSRVLNGKKAFKLTWDKDRRAELWQVLEEILAFGGQYSTITETNKKSKVDFVYPYFFEEQIKGAENYFDLFVVNSTAIKMYGDSDTSSGVVTQLSYEVVKLIETTNSKNQPELQYVATLDNKYKGFMQESLLHNFIDYRMFLHKTKNNWKINILVAGD